VASLFLEDGDSRQYVCRAERVCENPLCVVVVVGEEEWVTGVLGLDDGNDGEGNHGQQQCTSTRRERRWSRRERRERKQAGKCRALGLYKFRVGYSTISGQKVSEKGRRRAH